MEKIKSLVRIGIGSVFIIAAILKLLTIDEFEIYIYSFDIFNFLVTTIFSRLLIAGELILGLFLVFKVRYRLSWSVTLSVQILFTLFLTYVAIFRNDANCHCFGDIVELSPIESIVKNCLVIVMLFFIKEKRSDEEHQNRRLKLMIQGLTFLVLVLVFVVSPPDSIYKMIYSSHKDVSSINLQQSFDEVVKIDFNDEEMTFDTISSFEPVEGRQMIAIVSSGCKYCGLAMKKLSLIMNKNDIDTDAVDIFIWGSEGGICDFRQETMTEDFSYWHIMPNKAIDITYGRFPLFIWMEDKKIVNVGDFRDIDDNVFEY